MADTSLGASPQAVEALLREQQLVEFAKAGSLKAEDAERSASVRATKSPKNAKAVAAATAWILGRDTTLLTEGSGAIRFRAGQRIEDPYVKALLDQANAPLTPTE
jgi:hypothetical protein